MPKYFMTKTKRPVERDILNTALRMFNNSGIEYVGMREIASALDIRIGNLTYYFATKDELVFRLSLELAEENARTIVPIESVTIERFFEMLRQVFHNHMKYRCLLLSFVHIMQRNPLLSKKYSKTQAERNATLKANIEALVSTNCIRAERQEIEFLVASTSLVSRFWISEAVVSQQREPQDEQPERYLRMIARIFLPYATRKGKLYLEKVLSEEEATV
jgi:AcrR family transcriptional regulator